MEARGSLMRTLMCAMLVRSGAYGGTMSEVPVVTPTYVGYAARADGKVGEQAWSNATCLSNFRLVGSGEPASQRTEARVCYDRSNLYISFECFEDEMGRLKTESTHDGEHVWHDDSVEIWISPYSVADAAKTHQFVVSAAGIKTHVHPDHARREEPWRAAAVRMTGKWVAQITIPFDTLRPLGRNESCWRVNFCRNEYLTARRAVGRR